MEAAAFLDRFPEFETTAEAQLTAVLVEAAAAIDTEIFGGRYDDAHGLLTAHLLWTSPFGVSLRMEGDPSPPEKSRYFQEFAKIRREVTPRAIVT